MGLYLEHGLINGLRQKRDLEGGWGAVAPPPPPKEKEKRKKERKERKKRKKKERKKGTELYE